MFNNHGWVGGAGSLPLVTLWRCWRDSTFRLAEFGDGHYGKCDSARVVRVAPLLLQWVVRARLSLYHQLRSQQSSQRSRSIQVSERRAVAAEIRAASANEAAVMMSKEVNSAKSQAASADAFVTELQSLLQSTEQARAAAVLAVKRAQGKEIEAAIALFSKQKVYIADR